MQVDLTEDEVDIVQDALAFMMDHWSVLDLQNGNVTSKRLQDATSAGLKLGMIEDAPHRADAFRHLIGD